MVMVLLCIPRTEATCLSLVVNSNTICYVCITHKSTAINHHPLEINDPDDYPLEIGSTVMPFKSTHVMHIWKTGPMKTDHVSINYAIIIFWLTSLVSHVISHFCKYPLNSALVVITDSPNMVSTINYAMEDLQHKILDFSKYCLLH